MDTAMAVDLDPSNKTCKTCHRNIIPSNLPFKNCSVCRGKNRMQEARRVERKREMIKLLQARKTTPNSMNGDDGRGRENTTSGSSKLPAGPSLPKKQYTFLQQLGGKEKKQAIREIKALLQKQIQDDDTQMGVRQLVKNPVHGNAVEFLTASLLYEKLKSKADRYSTAGKRLKFHGYHSIVAVPTISHEDRVAMVAKDLRKFARIAFRGSVVIEKVVDYSICSVVYDCRCLRAFTGGDQPELSNQAQSYVGCYGTVRVTAELDNSHPHGLEGQKITIVIDH